MPYRLAWCLLLLSTLIGGEAMMQTDTASEEEIQGKYMAERSEQAASYRLKRAQFLAEEHPDYHAAAVAGYQQAQGALLAGHLLGARDLAVATLEEQPYAIAAPSLVHLILRTYAIIGDIDNTRLQVIDLWERFPEYADIRIAMEEVLITAETIRDRLGMTINLHANQPQEVVQVRDNYLAGKGPLKLFFFLREHGDRHTIAPRASLGIARCLLANGTFDRHSLLEARLAYDGFLSAYPDHPLVFQVLLEQSISYLLSYRGPQYDVGVLISGAGIIDQAEIYTEEKPERIEMVRTYRALIRSHFQDRDLFTADWYAANDHVEQARYYYRQVIARESTSPQGRTAANAMAALPIAEDAGQPLGDAVVPAPTTIGKDASP